MTSPAVLVERVNQSIVKITLNRPHALSALNVELLNNLCDKLREHAKAQVIVLEGACDKSFCAGEGLKQTLAPKTGSAEELQLSFEKLQDLTRLTCSSSAIVIAAVQGYAIGGGAELALAADFMIGGPNAEFRFLEVLIGYAATGGITLRLVQMVGLLRAKEMFLCGRMIDAEESLKIGLLTEIAGDPKERALELAFQMAKMPAVSAPTSKSSLERAVSPNLESVLQDEINVASYCFSQVDAAKAFSDFAKRKQLVDPPVTEIKDLDQALSHAVIHYPSRTFLRFGDRDITFKDFDADVEKLAAGLRHRVGPGDKALVMTRNRLEMVHIWFASNIIGATWVPINVELESGTLKHVIESAEAKVLIIDDEFFGEVQSTNTFRGEDIFKNGGSSSRSLISLYATGIPLSEAAKVLPSTTAAFQYTCDTTGRSKPCILSHQYSINQASVLAKSFSIKADDVFILSVPTIPCGCYGFDRRSSSIDWCHRCIIGTLQPKQILGRHQSYQSHSM